MFLGLRPKSGSAGASPSRLARRIDHKKRETYEPETALALVGKLDALGRGVSFHLPLLNAKGRLMAQV